MKTQEEWIEQRTRIIKLLRDRNYSVSIVPSKNLKAFEDRESEEASQEEIKAT